MKKHYFLLTTLFILGLAQMPAFAQDWNLQTLDYASDGMTDIVQVVLDDNSYPHVLYLADKGTPYYYYAKWTGSAWSIEQLPGNNTYLQDARFCLDSSGNPHIFCVWVAGSNGNTQYNYRASSGALTWTYYDDDYDYYPVSIYFEGETLKVLLKRGGSYYLATKGSSGTFSRITIATTTTGNKYNSIRDDEGSIYFTFYSGGDVHFGFYDGSLLSTFQVAENADMPSITIDNSGIPHISYYDSEGDNLMHAKLPLQIMDMLKAGKYAVKNTSPVISE